MPIVIIIALLLAGGVSVGAQNSTPGSVLYPVKTQVNERVKEALAFSTEGKANVYADLAGERLQEMEEVSANADVKAEVVADLKTRFEEQAQHFNEVVAKLEADGNHEAAARVAANFNAVVTQHEALLAKLSGNTTTSLNVSIRPTIETLVDTLRVLKAHTAKLEADNETSASAGDNESANTEDGTENDGADVEGGVRVQTGTSVNSAHATSGIQVEGDSRIGI